ncbi:MAG: hypothetical protein OJF55_000083 [Rhodanobacteraceae bacterium]|jgi:hypothetical protein|nr:MAG: hypothetical protein OJF55_000083 [Rhodanobacteraceae bacterium]
MGNENTPPNGVVQGVGSWIPGSAADESGDGPGMTRCRRCAFDRHSGRAQRDPESVSGIGCKTRNTDSGFRRR